MLKLSVAGFITLCLLSACKQAASSGEEVSLFVHSQTVDCVGAAPMKCLQVRYTEAEPWALFYESIEGFTPEAGKAYELLVRRTPVSNPPADVSSVKTELIRVISKD